MPERHGWRVFLVGLSLVLAGPGYTEAPTGAGAAKPEIEKKRESLLEGSKPKRAPAKDADGARKKQPEPEIVVRHLDYAECGWSVAETANFRIYHTHTQDKAGKVAVAAERARTAAHRKWFGGACPDWGERCDLYIYSTSEGYSEGTGAPSYSPGHSEIRAEGERVMLRRIFVHADAPGMVEAILPHEVTHAVLAGRFGDKQVPRWADEGMAVLDEPQERIDRHLRTLARHRDEGELYSCRDLLALRDYPVPRWVPVFYAQSVSMTAFLSSAKGPKTLARFVRDGMRDGYEAALKQYYGWDFDELERRWQKHAFSE
jgi:hypothetical protein